MRVVDSVRGPIEKRRRCDGCISADTRPIRWRNVLPVLATVTRQLHEPIVGTDPDLSLLQGRALDVYDRIELFGARNVVFDGPTGGSLPLLVVTRKVGAYDRPVRTAVGAFKDAVTAQPRHMPVPGSECDWRLPSESVARESVIESFACILDVRPCNPNIFCDLVRNVNDPVFSVGPNEVWIDRVGNRPLAVAIGRPNPGLV